MRRLHAAGPFAIGARLELDAEAARHAKVLRLRDGDRLELFDGEGTLATGTLSIGRGATVEIDTVTLAPSPRPVVLLQALAKGDKLDTVIRMATEIGVTAIHLVETEHAVARPDERRADRWRRIAREAARQSEQAWTPRIEGPSELLAVAKLAPADADKRVLAARGTTTPHAASDAAWLVIGPEGGLSDDEERALEDLGYARWTLPTGILRTETAAAVALGALITSRSAR